MLVNLLAHGLLHVVIDPLDHLLAQGVEQLLLVLKAEAFQEFLIHVDRLELLDVLQSDLDVHFFAAQWLIRMVVRRGRLDCARLAGLHPAQFLIQIIHLDAGDAPGAGDNLRIVLMPDDVAIQLHMHVADQIILVLHAAVFDRNQRPLLLPQVGHRLLNVLVGYLDLGPLDLDPLQLRNGDVRLDLNLEGIAERALLRQLHRLRLIEHRLADDLEVIFFHRLLIALLDKLAADLIFDVLAEAFLDQLLRRVTDAKTGNGRLLAQLLEGLFQFGSDALLGNLNVDFLGRRAGVLDSDRVLERRLFDGGGRVGLVLALIFGHGILSLANSAAYLAGKSRIVGETG